MTGKRPGTVLVNTPTPCGGEYAAPTHRPHDTYVGLDRGYRV